MIEFGPNEVEVPFSIAPENLPVALVVERAAAELERVSLLIHELEDAVLSGSQSNTAPGTIAAQQSVDVVQQSVDVLAAFLTSLAEECESWNVSVATPLSHVSLGAMRERLIWGVEFERR